MATPIKETPVLEGKDARRFEEEIKANEGKKIPAEERQQMVDTYNRIMARSNLVC